MLCRLPLPLLFVLMILFVNPSTAEESDPGDVVVLTAENFESKVKSFTLGDNALLVEFYAPWCGHCKTLEPKYVELGEQVSGRLFPISLLIM